ncbi:hypothetical protein SDC9_20811 [bioreactor metagenome]|uniref:Uncharacterized protein n=1 Tax=bioreactor metagenome TaxID=1076179 RepID=A0A644U854_9ZZZZ|nr:hypothetical protein [Desulfitobacterium hafniense]MEA5024583.1 hypothetical protein [Desulfitobacterium hafniense]
MLVKPLCALFLILSILLVNPGKAEANTNQVSQGSQTPVKEIKDYNPDASFHSQGHIQRWDNSPLSNQNPHLWTAMLLTVVVSGGAFTTMYMRKRRKEANSNPTVKLNQYLSALKSREERLTKKFQEADQKYCTGEITETDYKRFLKAYEENRVKTQGKIKEIEQLIEKE